MTTADKFTRTSYDTLLRLDFVSFAQRCFRELSPRTQFAMNWHIEIIAAKLTALRKGYIRRLIINMPPRCAEGDAASSVPCRLGKTRVKNFAWLSRCRKISPDHRLGHGIKHESQPWQGNGRETGNHPALPI